MNLWWSFQQDGSTREKDAIGTLTSVAMERVLWRRLLINVTPEWVVILLTTTSPLVATTLFVPQKLSGMLWECPEVNGADWIYIRPMHNIIHFHHIYDASIMFNARNIDRKSVV